MFLNLLLLVQLALAADETSPAKYSREELKNWCTALSRDLMSVKIDKCLGRDWLVGGRSVKNQPIPYTMWGNPSGRRVLILGSLHGDEITSVSLAFRWIDILEKSSSQSFLRTNYIMLAPLMNPDGYFIRPRTRTNANGIDLNRNFRANRWAAEALSHWKIKTKSDPRRYPGKTPGSEPEVQLVEKWIEEFKPELIISVHAPYGLLDHDGPISFPKTKAPLPVKVLGSFPGSLGQYAGVEKGIPVITVELRNASQMPDGALIADILQFAVTSKK